MGTGYSKDGRERANDGERKKRRRSEDDTADTERQRLQEENLNTPKRKKVKTTSSYIYEKLFVNGENSDVSIVALDKEWNLHKVYLCQSGYFSGMFSGAWRESHERTIHMKIPDDNIDQQALDIAFGSLYKDDVLIQPTRVVSVLAAATLLGLDGLIQQCADVMIETISARTVCDYYTVSMMYGQQEVTERCFDWLVKHIMSTQHTESVHLLKQISPSLMEKVVSSSDLFVMQVEMDVYTMLKKWAFLHVNSNWAGSSSKDLLRDVDNFFKLRGSSEAYLSTEEGHGFVAAFRGIRLQHIINDFNSVKSVEQDRIIPESWLLPVYRSQWLHMLKVEQNHDKGPDSSDVADFERLAVRCGRVLPRDTEYCWRWTGYNFGVDLLISYTKRLLVLKRNTNLQQCAGSASLQHRRHVVLRMCVASFDKLGQTIYYKSSGVMKLSLGQDQEAVIMGIDRGVSFPLYVTINFLPFTPSANLMPSPQLETVSQSDSSPDNSHSFTSSHLEGSANHSAASSEGAPHVES